jgi:two-component sensor histidine kinase
MAMLGRCLSFFVPILLTINLIAQEHTQVLRELEVVIKTEPDKAVELLNNLVDESSITDLQGMRSYGLLAISITKGNIADSIKAKANLLAGKAYMHLASYDTASILLNTAIKSLDPLSQKYYLGSAHHWKAYVKANVREFEEATKHYYQAVEIWEQIGLKNELVRTYSELADMFSMQEEHNKAIDYLQQAIKLCKSMDDPERLAEVLNNLSYTYVLSGNHTDALKHATESLKIWEAIAPDGRQVARVSNSRGNANKFLGNYDAALIDYERCRNLSEKAGFIRGLIVGTANIGHVLLLQKKYADALPYTLKAIELMKESGDTRNLWENYMHAAGSYEGLGDYQNAYRYRQLQHEEKVKEYEQKIGALQGGLADKYEAGQRAATIVLQEIQIQKQRNFQWLLGGFLALLLISLFSIFLSLRSRQRANKRLGNANNLLEKKNQENELLLREIHHRVKNNLQTVSSLLNLQSAGIKDEAALAAVVESRNRVRSMSLIHQKLYQGEKLASVEMKDYFETMGQAMIQSFEGQTDRIKLVVDMPPIDMDVDTAIPIGLIVNELMTNALKYAFPAESEGSIQLSLTSEDEDNLVLYIADNGVGQVSNKQSIWNQSSTGFGNRLVHMLVQQLEGSVKQDDINGYATTIKFCQTRRAV